MSVDVTNIMEQRKKALQEVKDYDFFVGRMIGDVEKFAKKHPVVTAFVAAQVQHDHEVEKRRKEEEEAEEETKRRKEAIERDNELFVQEEIAKQKHMLGIIDLVENARKTLDNIRSCAKTPEYECESLNEIYVMLEKFGADHRELTVEEVVAQRKRREKKREKRIKARARKCAKANGTTVEQEEARLRTGNSDEKKHERIKRDFERMTGKPWPIQDEPQAEPKTDSEPSLSQIRESIERRIACLEDDDDDLMFTPEEQKEFEIMKSKATEDFRNKIAAICDEKCRTCLHSVKEHTTMPCCECQFNKDAKVEIPCYNWKNSGKILQS